VTQLPEALRPLAIAPEVPIIEAVEVLNRAHKRIVLVVDGDARLLGVITDSNIRHAVLDRIDFKRPAADIMVRNPVTVSDAIGEEQVLAIMGQTQIYQIPVLDAAGRICAVHFIDELLRRRGKAEKRVAVVMAGGMGQRLRPLTETTPKPLLEIGGRPILFIVLDHLIASGFDRIFITVNYLADRIRHSVASAGRYRDAVEFIEEDKPLGTAGALALLPERPTAPFLVANADLLMRVAVDEMMRFHEHEKNAITVALKEERYAIPYGVAKLEGTRILGIEEKPEMAFFINAGLYVLDPSVLELIPKGRQFHMTDVVAAAQGKGLRVGCFPVHEYWQDIGFPAQLEQARQDYDALFPVPKRKP
jgi:dTDP-glucose pyrophosphorylase